MRYPYNGTKIRALFTAGLLLSAVAGQAAGTTQFNTIQLEKPAYFVTLSGNNVKLQPGNYEIAALADSLQVSPQDGKSPIQLAITLDTHDQDLTEPVAVSVPGIPEGEFSDRHVLALFLPGGLAPIAASALAPLIHSL
ncbi:MAG: hypothetical protein P8X46_09460 [Nitrospirales bacterium]